MNFGPFANENGVAVPPAAAAAIAAGHNAAGKTDDGTRAIATPIDPIAYYDPGMPVGHGPAIVARNTLQKAHAEASGFLTDVNEVKRRRDADQAAKDAEVA